MGDPGVAPAAASRYVAVALGGPKLFLANLAAAGAGRGVHAATTSIVQGALFYIYFRDVIFEHLTQYTRV